MSDEGDDTFPGAEDLNKSFSDESDNDESDNDNDNEGVPEWARSKSFDPQDNIRHPRPAEGSNSELAAMEEHHAEEMKAQRDINRKYCDRLKRRSDLITELRNAYLRDIVTLKHVINEQLADDERAEVISVWKKSIPSIDIRQHLMLYGPKEASFDTIPCDTCGGSVELVHHDSSEIEELSKALSHMDKNKDDLRLIIATKGAQLENIQDKMEKMETSHKEEKKVLYKEMRSIKAKSEEVHKDNIQLTNQVRGLRDHLSELRVKEERFDKVNDSLSDTMALLQEANKNIKNMEDATAKSKETISSLTEQLAVCTQEKEMAEGDVLKQAAHIKSITNVSSKHKANSEALSKKATKLEKMLDDSRREIDALSAKVQDLEMNLEQQTSEMTAEIESLESMLDTAREEGSTVNEELREVQDKLTTRTSEKENLQNSYNELHFAKEEAVSGYEQQIAILKMKAQRAEEELHRKSSTFDAVEADMKKYKELSEKFEGEAKEAASLKKDYEKTKKELDKMTEADKDRRRKVREMKKKEEEEEKQRLAEVAARPRARTPEQKQMQKGSGKKDVSPKKLKDKQRREVTQKAFEAKVEEGKGVVAQAKYVPHKRQRGKCRSSPLTSPNASTTVDEVQKVEEMANEVAGGTMNTDDMTSESSKDLDSAEIITAGLPPRPTNGTTNQPGNRSTALAVAVATTPTIVKSAGPSSKGSSPVIISRSSSRDIYSSGGFDYFNNLGVAGPVELSPVLSFLVDAPQQLVLFDLPDSLLEGIEESEGGEESKDDVTGSVDFSVSAESSVHHYDFGTHRHMQQRLQKTCRKLIREQNLAVDIGMTEEFAEKMLHDMAKMDSDEVDSVASIEVAPSGVVHQDGDHNCNHELNDYVAQNMRIMHQGSDDQSLCSDINCEHHDLDSELHNETAKIFGMSMRDTHYMLQSKMTVKDSKVALELLAPKILEMSSITAKAQIGMWKAMRSTKKQTDIMCKLAAACQKMMPYWGGDLRNVDMDSMANLHQKLTDVEYFDQFREKWFSAVQDQLDIEMMRKLTEKEWNEKLSLFVDLPSNSHFDYDEDREDSFDSALNSMFVMETFTQKMSEGVDSLLTGFFLDWAVNKLNLLNFQEGGSMGGGASEVELQRVYSELTTLKAEMDVLQFDHDNLKGKHEALLEKVAILEPEAARVKELVERSGKLSNDMQALNLDFVSLTESHTILTKSNTKLVADHKAANELIKNQSDEIKATKEAMARVQSELDERNAIQQAMTDELEAAREKERIRLFELISTQMQTEPFIEDAGCQTEFIVPPMSLHHTMSSNISHSTPASAKRSFYPVVTPGGPSKGLMASLHDEFHMPMEIRSAANTHSGDFPDHASATSQMTSSIFDEGTHMSSLLDGSDFMDERSVMTPIIMHHDSDLFSTNSRPGSKSNSKKGFNESLKLLNKISASQQHGKLNVGLPRIHSMYSDTPDTSCPPSPVPQPLSGKLSPIKYEKPNEGQIWARSDTVRISSRKSLSSRSESTQSITSMLESHRRNQAPAHRKSMNSR